MEMVYGGKAEPLYEDDTYLIVKMATNRYFELRVFDKRVNKEPIYEAWSGVMYKPNVFKVWVSEIGDLGGWTEIALPEGLTEDEICTVILNILRIGAFKS